MLTTKIMGVALKKGKEFFFFFCTRSLMSKFLNSIFFERRF